MRKYLKVMVIMTVVVAMIAMISMSGCSTGTATEDAADGVEENAKVVAGEEELYINAIGWTGWEWAQQVAHGMKMAEEYWNDLGENIKLEFTGPVDSDAEKIYEGLETAIAKNPLGIYTMHMGLGEDDLLGPYHDNGGIVFLITGVVKDYVDCYVGNDLFYYGTRQGMKASEDYGDSFKYAIDTLPESPNHQLKRQGIQSILDQYDNIEFLGIIDTAADVTEGAANVNAFMTANPDVDVIISTTSTGAASCTIALQEAGYEPGKVKLIGSELTPDNFSGIESGYIDQVLVADLVNWGFYALSGMHLMHLNLAPLSGDDESAGYRPGPSSIIGGVFWVDNNNVGLYKDYYPKLKE